MTDADATRRLLAEIEAEPAFDVDSFDNDDAVALGLIAVEVIRERGWDLAVRIVVGGDVPFQAKLGRTGPENDPWLVGKAAVAERFGTSSLLVRLRHEVSGQSFEDLPGIDHSLFRAHGGSIPIRVRGDVVGSITASGEPDVVDHSAAAEAVRRFTSR